MVEDQIPLFDELWDYNDPEATAVRLRQLLPQAESTGDSSYLIQLLTQLARTQSLQRKFEEAHQLLDKAESMLAAGDDIAEVRYLLERGRSFNSAELQSQARPFFIEAWELASAAEHEFYAIDAAHMMGIAGATPEIQLVWNQRALEAAENARSPRARRWLGSLNNNLGWTFHDRGDYEEALSLFQGALQWHESQLAPASPGPVRIARWCVARTLRSLGRLEEALKMQQALLAEWEADGQQDGYVLEEMAECLLALKRREAARPYFKLAHQILSQDGWLAANETTRLDRLLECAGDSQNPTKR